MTAEQVTKTEKNRVAEWLPKIAKALGGKVKDDFVQAVVDIKNTNCILKILFINEEPIVYLIDPDTSATRGSAKFGLIPETMLINSEEGYVVFIAKPNGFLNSLRVDKNGTITQTIEPPLHTKE